MFASGAMAGSVVGVHVAGDGDRTASVSVGVAVTGGVVGAPVGVADGFTAGRRHSPAWYTSP